MRYLHVCQFSMHFVYACNFSTIMNAANQFCTKNRNAIRLFSCKKHARTHLTDQLPYTVRSIDLALARSRRRRPPCARAPARFACDGLDFANRALLRRHTRDRIWAEQTKQDAKCVCVCVCLTLAIGTVDGSESMWMIASMMRQRVQV